MRLGRFVLALAVVALLAGCGESHHATSTNSTTETRQAIYVIPSSGKPLCGYLNVGIGWRVTVANGVSCTAARRIMLAAITTPSCLRHRPCNADGHRYWCLTVPGDTNGSESVLCIPQHGTRMVAAAISNS
jgi:hypothetical protein